jgi:hypothetical protein
MTRHLVELAPVLCGGVAGYGTGVAACRCRLALCRTLMSSSAVQWCPDLLGARKAPDKAATVVATQPVGVPGRRTIVMACLDASTRPQQGIFRVSLTHSASDGLGIYAYAVGGTEAEPLHMNYHVGMVRKSSAAPAAFSAAADAWVRGECNAVLAGRKGVWYCRGPFRKDFTDDVNHWGWKNCVQGDAYGYDADVQKDVLAFAAFERVEDD